MSHDTGWGSTERVSRRGFLQAGLLGSAAAAFAPTPGNAVEPAAPQPGGKIKPFELDEVTIGQLRKAIDSGEFTARAIALMYLDRIHAIDQNGPGLRSVIEVNPDALADAEGLDKERKEGKRCGPLHGIPVLLKDNIDTKDRMASTSGSLALVDAKPPEKDAFLVEQLRKAGAIILGKTNLSEWAEMRSSYCTGGWSGRGGLTRNPYALDRNPSGSSSGSAVAVAANLCAVAVGTETSSSIVRPSSVNGIVGIKPTVGLVSRSGIIPLALSQDTAGPMTRTVRDAATLLNVLAASGPEDKRALARPKKLVEDYTVHLKEDGLKKKRIGVVRNFCGIHEGADALMEKAIEAIQKAGASVEDPANLPAGLDTPSQWFGDEFTVLCHEFKADLNAYLRTRKPRQENRPIPGTLADLIKFNEEYKDREMPFFGQDQLITAEATKDLDQKDYLDAVRKIRKLAREDGIDGVMDKLKLDALVAPTEGPAWVTDLVAGDHFRTRSTSAAAIAGYPSISVPMGHVFGLPVGISFFGRAWSEPVLIEVAYAFEQATKHRMKPQFLSTAALWG